MRLNALHVNDDDDGGEMRAGKQSTNREEKSSPCSPIRYAAYRVDKPKLQACLGNSPYWLEHFTSHHCTRMHKLYTRSLARSW